MGEPSRVPPAPSTAAVRVTFDTNTLASVVSPETAQRDTGKDGAIVRDAIRAGRVAGFFSETLVTIEGIKREDRADVLGKSRIVVEATAQVASTQSHSIALGFSVGGEHVRPPLDHRLGARLQSARELGMQALMAPARFGDYHLDPATYPLFAPIGGMTELLRCMDEVHDMAEEIERRGVGRAIAVALGVGFSTRAGIAPPERWLQGLGRAPESERTKVAKAAAEWADGDSLASHYGFGMHLFCSEDFGRKADRSVLDPDNRTWASKAFGIEFVTLAELARRC